MELTKNIFFNTDKLVQNSKVKISYTGTFFENGSNEVYIHYGFGLNWDNLNEIKMERTELGFQTELLLLEGETFNFCFRNENNIWDNNEGINYIFNLEKPCLDLILTENDYSIAKPNKLRRSYLWSKKIKIAVYKIIKYIPKLLTGNYRKKISE